jgi:hypothetical protein
LSYTVRFYVIHVNSNTTFISNSKTSETIKTTPNPFREIVVLELGDMFENNSKIEIYNVQGQLVHRQIILSRSITIDMSKYHKGVYFLRLLKNDKTIMTEKLIKE